MEQTIGNTDSHHEVGQSLAFAVLAPDHAGAIPLGVHAPPAEICAQPLGRDGAKTLAGKSPDFIEAFPRILLPLQSLDSLRSRLCPRICHRSFDQKKPPPADRTGGGYKCRFLNDS